jgi:hypothetical protein
MTHLIDNTGTRRIEKTKYNGRFAFNALRKFFASVGADVDAEVARTTNSYYFEGEWIDGRTIEIRISDHTKPFNFDFEKIDDCVEMNQYRIEAHVTKSETYAELMDTLKKMIL